MAAEFNAAQGSYFSFELDGVNLGYFTGCTGLSSELSVITHRTMSAKGNTLEIKYPDRQTFSEVVLKRGFTADMAVNDWYDDTVDAGAAVQRKTGSIVILNRQLDEIARFNLEGCFPSKLSVSDLNAKSGEAMIEELTIRHENLLWA
ncbi:MAG: phage tail protein [Ilumatobacter sp.]|jgi:phage tail-like protein|uniref:phage tail protein n=1 Tax=Ilumatobacter sp. TaxID=1967498 RepID=UPI00391C707D